ncbi:glycoside hydrolase family 43 protein [Rhodohalobacter sp. 614A]|uniref:glycoside hydrolase family 43 protein n=1 Tax=Rhodohalobacter sp. 614A TaxID=2908649 RepID=UPI001F1D7C9F|nr:glycoside hydrolase family 43 protein [Rhodohalobacter sp. 614A]
MRTITLPAILLLLFSVLTVGCSSEANGSTEYFGDDDPPEHNIYFGDPYVLLDDGTYYMYGTGRDSDTGIEVYTSEDLENWIGPVGVTDGFALHKDDVIGDRWFWAPEVYNVNGTYYMFFSTEEHMAIATSESPLGPFVQEEQQFLADFKAIDHSLFVDTDGAHYIYFAKFEDGLEIWGAEFAEDFSEINFDTMERQISQSQEWEKSQKDPVGIVNEGVYIIKHEGMYYMIYSANHYASPDYGIGMAYAEHPLGPWTKDETNPILQNPDHLVGTGHSMLFEGKDGRLYMVYHAHNDQENIHPRIAYINEVGFVPVEGEDRYRIQVKEPRIEPMYNPPAD